MTTVFVPNMGMYGEKDRFGPQVKWFIIKDKDEVPRLLRIALSKMYTEKQEPSFDEEDLIVTTTKPNGKKKESEWSVRLVESKSEVLLLVECFDSGGDPNPKEIMLMHYLEMEMK